MQTLLAKGADVNAKSNPDKAWYMLDIMMEFLGEGDPPELILTSKEKNGLTAILCATRNGHNRIVELLKQAGARE